MSYTIEYKRKIYYKNDNFSEKTYFMLVKQGDNNCYESNGQRVKYWDLAQIGWEYSIIGKVCERAGECEGGSLKRGVGFSVEHISPEEYLALWRQEIPKAKPLESMLKDFNIRVDITYPKKMTKDMEKQLGYRKDYFDKIIEKYKGELIVSDDYYHKELNVFSKEIKSIAEFEEFTQLPDWKFSRCAKRSFYFYEIK